MLVVSFQKAVGGFVMALVRLTFINSSNSLDKMKKILVWSFVTQLMTHFLAFGLMTLENMNGLGSKRVFCDELSNELYITIKQFKSKY